MSGQTHNAWRHNGHSIKVQVMGRKRGAWARAAAETLLQPGETLRLDSTAHPYYSFTAVPAAENIPARLEYLRGEIRAERISYSELSELQGLAAHIDAGDSELLQWAGVPEDAPTAVELSALQGLTGRALHGLLPRLPYDTAYLLAAVLQAGHIRWGTALLERHGYTLTEDPPFIKGGALESTNPPAPHAFKYLAARQAVSYGGLEYAAGMERHIDELLAKGIDVRHENLGERLAGNDGD